MRKPGTKRSDIMKILFVCTGNTCRSPMAEGIAKKLFPNIEFSSAGIFAEIGSKPSENAVLALKELNIDISEHTAVQLTLNITKEFDFIVPMTKNHRNLLLQAGVSENKIKMLDEEIPDPYMQSLEIYSKTAEMLKKSIKKLIGEINDDN